MWVKTTLFVSNEDSHPFMNATNGLNLTIEIYLLILSTIWYFLKKYKNQTSDK